MAGGFLSLVSPLFPPGALPLFFRKQSAPVEMALQRSVGGGGLVTHRALVP